MQPNQEVINRWSGSAPFWEKHREIIRQMFAPVTDALVEDGQIGSRQSVLDIATGPGEPALTIASLVGPEGNCFGVDPIPEMVAAARREASRLRVEKCTVRRCLCGSSSISGRHIRCRSQSIRSDVLSVSGRRGPRDVESAQAGTEAGAGGLAFRRKKSIPLFAVASRRSVCRIRHHLSQMRSDTFRFATPGKLLADSERGRRDRSDRAPVSIHDTRADVS